MKQKSLKKPGLEGDVCPTCNYSGSQVVGVFEVDCTNCRGHGVVNIEGACGTCHGTGDYRYEQLGIIGDCPTCHGSGHSQAA